MSGAPDRYVQHATFTTPTPADRAGWAWTALFTAIIAAGAATAAAMGGVAGPELIFAIGALVVVTVPYLGFLTTSVAGRAQAMVQGRPLALLAGVLFFAAVYVFYGLGTGTFGWIALLRVVGFAAAPAILAATAGQRDGVTWQDLAIVACIWLPFNFGLLDSIWEWPANQAAYILNTPIAIDVALLTFIAWRRLPNVPLRWQINLAELRFAAAMLLAFMAISLPIGLGTGFLTIAPKLSAPQLIGQPLGIFFFIAIPEELLFRGLLLGMLRRRTGKPIVSLVISSLLFGVSHWHNPGMPDFRYLGLAALAGMFYGYTYLRSRSLVAPALLHSAVDTLWSLFFHI